MNPENDLLKITSLAWSFVPFSAVRFSIEENIFSLITEKELTANDIAMEKGWQTRPTQALVSLLSGLDILKDENEKVKLTELSKKFLLRSSDFYIGDFFLRNMLLEKAYSDLKELMVKDVPNKEMNNHVRASFGLNDLDKTAIKQFGKPMLSASKIILSAFIKQYPVDQNATILDIGAGLGALEEVITQNHKGHITVLETPEVANVAELNLSHYPNIVFQKESWHSWEPKENYDLVFLNHVLHEEKLDEAKKLFEKAIASVNENGKLIVISFMGEEGESLNISNIFRMNLLLEMGSDLPSLSWVRKQAEALNIKEEKTIELPGGRVAWIGVRA